MRNLQQLSHKNAEIKASMDKCAAESCNDEKISRLRNMQSVGGADIFAVGYSSIFKAAVDSSVDGVRYFVNQNKSCLKIHDITGKTALHIACEVGATQIVEELLNFGADPNIRDRSNDRRPVHLAAKCGHEVIIEILETHRADLLLVDSAGCTAAHLAAYGGHTHALAVLLHLSPDIMQVQCNQGKCVLHYLALRLALVAPNDCSSADLESAVFLSSQDLRLKRICDFTFGDTPLHTYCRHGGLNQQVIALLGSEQGLTNSESQTANSLTKIV